MTVSLCGAANLDGYDVHCMEPSRHQGPHGAEGGGPGLVGVAWCTPPSPCRGGACRGPCHPDDHHQEQQ